MNNYEQATQEVRDAFQALCKGRVEAAVKAEREACAVLVEGLDHCSQYFPHVPDIIRARGNT